MCRSLINRYTINVSGHTSYPNVPLWDNDRFSMEKWHAYLKKSLIKSNASDGISLYIHLPFCEKQCDICNHHMQITTDHNLELPYIKAVLQEWHLYTQLLDCKPIINELHLGGGTPTFFSAKHLEYLVSELLKTSELSDNYVFSFEGHPNYTTQSHLQTLYDIGFRHVSFNIQDYNFTLQNTIHRVQPNSNVEGITNLARAIGYTSVGHDIVLGLPFQTTDDVIDIIERTKAILPDRITFYYYQPTSDMDNETVYNFTKKDLPTKAAKHYQHTSGKALLKKAGYFEVGINHFALESDLLYRAMKYKNLHRNFMGYTASRTQVMLGLGVSSISDAWYGFSKNVESTEQYCRLLENNTLPISQGHILTDEDLIIRKHIMNLMSHFRTSWLTEKEQFEGLPDVIIRLRALVEEGLVSFERRALIVTEKGKPFIQNICMAFDLRLHQQHAKDELLSKAS